MKVSSIYDFILTEKTLQLLGAGGSSLPTVCPWPQNKEKRAILYPDNPGIWGNCPDVGASGDLFDILKAHFNTDSIQQVLSCLEQEGCIVDSKAIPTPLILHYEALAAKRKFFLKYWEESQARFLNLDCDPNLAMKIGGTFPSGHPGWTRGTAPFLGSSTKKDFEAAVQTRLKAKGRNVLFAAYQDLPGRISGFRVFFFSYGTRMDESFRWVEQYPGGIFMGNSVPHNSEVAIALTDPVLMLHLQAGRAALSMKPLPLLGYTEETRYWPVEWTKRVIFWGSRPSTDLFLQSRKIPQAFISTFDIGTDPYASALSNSDAWFRRILKEARPWVIELKDFLLRGCGYNAVDFLDQMQLTGEEIGHLLFECAAEEKKKISAILNIQPSLKSVYFGNKKIVEKNEEWHVESKQGYLTRISNAVFRLTKSVSYDGSPDAFFGGEAFFQGSSFQFESPVDDFQKNPFKILRETALKKGLGVLRCAKGWGPSLIEISLLFHPKKLDHVQKTAKVGWVSEAFQFPQFILREGRAEEHFLPVKDLPCSNLTFKPISADVIAAFCEYSDVNRFFWALFLSIAANIAAEKFGKPIFKLAGLDRAPFIDLVARTLDLPQRTLTAKGVKEVNSSVEHSIPVYVKFDKIKTMHSFFENLSSQPFLTALTFSQALLLSDPTWLFIPLKNSLTPTKHLLIPQNWIPWWIVFMQKNPSSAPLDALDWTISGILQMLKEVNKDQDLEIVSEAPLLIKKETPIGPVSKSELFIFSLFSLLADGTVHLKESGRKQGLIEIRENDVVISTSVFSNFPSYCNIQEIMRALNKEGFLASSAESDWKIHKKKWEAAYVKWLGLVHK